MDSLESVTEIVILKVGGAPGVVQTLPTPRESRNYHYSCTAISLLHSADLVLTADRN
ncbi:hypothetical protein M404DRAFT_1003645 [Pisolithus tinctorius Marx 270]|uniref:Uncharacterized protein n=1 Tax=Pisolithus tinctorius Marx 270 TaxID=870435 RepID=A0A0C3NI12_PISTI|nr:hypothetical protein M404DRAFT_1003645 [Pisolithus tinctorius Marx 270]